MDSYCPDDILRRVHYLIRQWLFFLDEDEIVGTIEDMGGDFDDLSIYIKDILGIFIEEIIEGIDPLLEKHFIYSERYLSLSPQIKSMFDSDPYTIMKINGVIEDALMNQRDLVEIKKEIKEIYRANKKCVSCEIISKLNSKKGIMFS